MARFTVKPTPLVGVVIVERQRIGDARGFLSRIFCADELREAGFVLPVAQINHTLTETAGTVRGLHFQLPPHAEDKLVTCIRGRVFDVALDLRAGSPTFLRWHAEEISADNGRALFIPQGCAHGFQALEDGCELLYLHSRAYSPNAEAGLSPLDPSVGIAWPLAVTAISARDAGHPAIQEDFTGVDA